MITFENVKKVYDGDVVALNGIDLTITEGETTVLVGPSGCGKTTTIELVNRLVDPTEGTITFDGTPLDEHDKLELRRQCGYVIQKIGLFDHMTVAENVGLVPDLEGWDDDRIDERVDSLLELVELPPEQNRDQYPTQLSGGQQQRVGVARALAAEPKVLLMDEPFGALDPITRRDLQDEFLSIQEQISTTIVFVTHDIDEALKMGDKIAVYDHGEIVQFGTPQEVITDPANEFVEQFVGEERLLKHFQVLSVSDVMSEPTSVPTSSPAAEGFETLEPSDLLKRAMHIAFEPDTDPIAVTNDGEVVGQVTRADLLDQIDVEQHAHTPEQ